MTDHTTPLAPDQPEQHVYEPPHATDTNEFLIDGDWFTQPGKDCIEHPFVWATVNTNTRKFDISVMKCVGMDAGEAMKIASFLADAVRWATGEIEKLNTPAPSETAKQDAGRQDASGGQSSR